MRRSSHNALFVFGLLSALALAACGGAGSTPDPEAPEAPEAPVIAGATPGPTRSASRGTP